MFNDRATDAKLNCTFENALRLLCKGSESKLEKLKLMVETFHTKNNIYPAFMKNRFTGKDAQCGLRSKNHLQLLNVKTEK